MKPRAVVFGCAPRRLGPALLISIFVSLSAGLSHSDPVVTAFEFEAPGIGPSLGTLDLGAGTFNPITAGQVYDDLALSPSNALYALWCVSADCSAILELGVLVPQSNYQFADIVTISNPNIYSIAFNASGVLYATDGSALYTIDVATGVATMVGSLGPEIQALSGGVGGIRFDASGDLLAVAYDEDNALSVDVSEIWTVNPSTGIATYLVTPLDTNGHPLIDLLPGLVNGAMYGTAYQALPCGVGCYQMNGVYTYSFPLLNSATALASVNEPYVPIFGANAPSSSGSSHPPFFAGEVSLGSAVYYLQFPDRNLFGYYNYVASSILYHYDMGFEAFLPGSAADVYFYDFTSTHWWYTSSTLFPYLYDFTLNSWIYYFPNTKNPGHYTTNPRYFSNLTTGKIFTM